MATTTTTKKATTATKAPAKRATTATSAEEKGFTLKIIVKLYGNALGTHSVYITGNLGKLGDWNAAKAKAMKSDNMENFTLSVTGIKKGTEVAFKVLKDLTWEAVEKGMYGEDLENHVITVNGATQIEVGVSNWAN